jgi:S-adenosyl-methyltransferase mraW
MEFSHETVLLKEAVDGLSVKENGIYIDGTAGGGGHSFEIAKRLKNGRLFALDRDPDAVAAAKTRLAGLPAEVIRSNYTEFDAVLKNFGYEKMDGMLLDLGVSSYQLDNPERGFSYRSEAPLDMRMDKTGTSAGELLNTLSEAELAKIFYEYGEERYGGRIARAVVRNRPLRTTTEFADVISDCLPAAAKRDGHPARRCFQALRIAVNGELDAVSDVIGKAFDRLNVGGRIAIITFHSLEDRIVKKAFASFCTGCTCPPDFPVCVCGKTPAARLVNKKPIVPSLEETENNPRSRSAKLRILEKIKEV